jgi:hypothetical protein
MFIVVLEDILLLAIGVGWNSVTHVILVGSIDKEQKQQ